MQGSELPALATMDRFEEIRKKVIPVLKPYVIRISVFGSYARGEETGRSDIDILIQLKPSNKRPPLGLEYFGLEQEIRELLHCEVDLVTEDGLSPYVRPYVEKDKVVIYEER